MSEHPNAQRMRQVTADVRAGNIPGVLEAFSTECTWRVPAGHSLPTTLRGHDGLMAFFGRVMERTNGTFRVEPDDAVASDDHVVIFLRVSGETADGTIDGRFAHFATVDKDGKFVKNWFLASDPDSLRLMVG